MNALAILHSSPQPLAEGSLILKILFMFLVALIFLWFVLNYIHYQAQRLSDAWQSLASELGFTYKPARGPAFRRKSEEIEGLVDGTTIRLTRYGLSPGLDSAIYTRWSAALTPPPGFVLYIHRKHMLSKLASAFGYEDTMLGSPEFDETYCTKSDEPDKAKQILTPEVQEKIARLHSACMLVNETGINLVWAGQIADTAELKRGLEVLKALLKNIQPALTKPDESKKDPDVPPQVQ